MTLLHSPIKSPIRSPIFGPQNGNGAAPSAPIVLTATDHFFTFATTPTGSSKALGSVAADRVTAIEIAWQDTGTTKTLDSVTVGGASATRVVRFAGVATDRNVEIWAIDSGSLSSLSAATTANIVLTFSAGNTGVVVQVHKLTGTTATASSTSTGTTSVSGTVPTNGAAVVGCLNSNISAASISGVTTDYNQAETNSLAFTGIHGSTTTSGSVTATFSGTSSSTRMVVAVFSPR